MAECITEKSKHLQRKNFGTAGEQIQLFNMHCAFEWMKKNINDVEMILWASLLVEEESVYFIWKNGVSQLLQANCRQLENNEQTGK